MDRSVVAADNLRSLECQVRDHVLGNRKVDEVVESFGVLLRSCHCVRHFEKKDVDRIWNDLTKMVKIKGRERQS